MDFQWKGNDIYELFFDRLNSLYKQGALNYINISVEDLSNKDLDKLLSSLTNRDKIKKAFVKLRLYKNNEFAFKEVYNEDTFLENALIVREVVQLLQSFRLKYNQKQQFLGDFFERLLNTGFKQEVGQYFTPIPLAGFVCKSLPIENIISTKNENKEKYFLPYVIDFASGSGHFLTEIMDEINHYVDKISDQSDYIKGGRSAKEEFNSYSNNYKWAKEYVYGIEKDYRLAKTTKIHTFLNGDGDANIVMGDGLDNFKRSKSYIKKLKEIDINEAGCFDIVVANPPYSISEFKNTLLAGAETFSLYKYITEKSGNIECLFVERAKRVYLGEKTFMATNAFTVIMFLEKRKSNELEAIENMINTFFDDYKEFSFNGTKKVIEKYLQYVYKDLPLKDYKYFINNDHPDSEHKHIDNELFNEYIQEGLSIEGILKLEKQKLFHFIISYNQRIVIVDSNSGNKELDFLGYEFSGRRGSEGIKLKKNDAGDFKTKLFNNKNLIDSSRVNYYILKSFENNLPNTIHKDLQGYVEIVDFSDLFDFTNYTFDNTIRYGIQHTKFKGKTVKLKTYFEPIKGVTYKKQDQQRFVTSKMVLTSTHINLEKGTYKLEKPIYLREDFDLPAGSKLKKNDLFVSTSNSLKHLGKVAYIDKDLAYFGGGFCTILRPKQTNSEGKAISIYAKNILQNSKEFRAFINLYKNSRISNIGDDLLNFRIPIPNGK
jgi:type I restriction enzyme M protein